MDLSYDVPPSAPALARFELVSDGFERPRRIPLS